MTSEVCPFCGKTYKRLKSHLPHCKAAQRDVAAEQTPPSNLATANLTAKVPRSVQTPSVMTDTQNRNMRKKVSALSSTPAVSPSIRSNIAHMPSAAINSPSKPKSKRKSLRALTEDAAQAESKMNPHKDTKTKGAREKKALHIKKAAESLSTAKDASGSGYSLDGSRTSLWVDSTGEIENLSANKLLVKSRHGQHGRITLQDVKATLHRAQISSQSSKSSVVGQIARTDDLSSKKQNDIKCSAEPLPSSSSQHTQQKSDKKKSLLCEQASLIPVQHSASPHTKPASNTTPLHLSSRVKHGAPLSHPVSPSEGLKVGHRMTGLLSVSPAPTHVSSPHPLLLAPPVRVETPRADESSRKERLQLKVRKQNNTEGDLTQRHLGQVRLRELPEWLACKTPRNPRDVVEMVQRGWQWYHRRYIDVKKGGVGGVGMLLAGYCVLSYIWTYPHIKHDRWRKFH